VSGLVFPLDILPPLQSGFSRTFDASSTRTEFEVGVARKRRNVRAAPRLMRVTWDMTAAQFDAFDRWFVNTLQNGSATFDVYIEGLWYEANFADTPPYDAEYQFDAARVIVDARLILGVGPASGIPVRPNIVELNATLTAGLLLRSTAVRSVVVAATLPAGIEIGAEVTIFSPMNTTLVAGMAVLGTTTALTSPVAATLTAGMVISAAVSLVAAPPLRVFFWYDPVAGTSTLCESTTFSSSFSTGLSDVGPTTRNTPSGKWLGSIASPAETKQYQWYAANSESRLLLSPQPNWGGGQTPAATAYDATANKYLVMAYNNAGTLTQEHVLNVTTGVIESSTTVTVDGFASPSYQFYPWQLLKFGGVWHSFEANSGITNHYIRDAGAANWIDDLSDWYGTPPATAKSTIGADTLQSGATLAVMVDFVDPGASPQAHYLRFLTSTDGTAFTQRGTYLLNSGAGLGSTSGTVGYVIYTSGTSSGSLFIRIGSTLAYYWYTTTTGGAGPGLYVLISNTDGTTWTPHKCTIDGTDAAFSTRFIEHICGIENGAAVVGRYTVNLGFSDCTCHMVKSFNGIAFTTVPDSEVFAPGYGTAPGDPQPIPGSIVGDYRAPVLSSGNRVMFERILKIV